MNKNEYKEAVNKIVISDELREKIIHNSSRKNTHTHKYKHFQKAAGIAACFAVCMLSYYTVTNYYHFPNNASVVTPPTPVLPAVGSDSLNTENSGTAPVFPDTDNIKSNTSSSEQNLPEKTNRTNSADNSSEQKAANNSANSEISAKTNNPAASAAAPSANPDSQPTPPTSEIPEQDDFPPLLSESPAPDSNSSSENAAAGSVSSSYTEENKSAVANMEQELGYTIKIPHQLPNDYKTDSLSVMFGELAQIIYTSKTDKLYYRTAKSSEDISGDYNNYSETETVVINGNDVTIKGNDSLYHNACWFEGDDAFSLYSNNGIEKDSMIDIIESVE